MIFVTPSTCFHIVWRQSLARFDPFGGSNTHEALWYNSPRPFSVFLSRTLLPFEYYSYHVRWRGNFSIYIYIYICFFCPIALSKGCCLVAKDTTRSQYKTKEYLSFVVMTRPAEYPHEPGRRVKETVSRSYTRQRWRSHQGTSPSLTATTSLVQFQLTTGGV